MRFEIDKQTINDLELYEKNRGEPSVFSLFNYTQSKGGKNRLEYIFSNPLNSIKLIEKRISIIDYFKSNPIDFKIDKECLGFIEHYLIQQNAPVRDSTITSFFNAIKYKFNPGNDYFIVQRGIRFLIFQLNEVYEFAKKEEHQDAPEFIINCKRLIIDKIENSPIKAILRYRKRIRFYPAEYGKLDYYFRNLEIIAIREILDIIYDLDVYQSIAFASRKHNFILPEFTSESNHFEIKEGFHPFIDNPVKNDFKFLPDKNVCFVTGPNMAGKSTFLRAISISVYLAHLGFPVPAKSMKTSLFNGLLTTINLSDNLNNGYSHFYNEILRVKFVAERINQVGNIFVIFDELFRGTNVKDAYEASLSVISAFSDSKNGLFAISTHIIEVADQLKDNNTVFFRYFEANLIDETPHYNYKLKVGVTDERIGMYILRKEKVIETIEGIVKSDKLYVKCKQ